jgi:hypothetical protein
MIFQQDKSQAFTRKFHHADTGLYELHQKEEKPLTLAL